MDEQEARQLIEKYSYQYVLLLPPWREIYKQDSERDHTFEHAEMVYEKTRDWYLRVGYKLVDVPKDTAEVRAQFILNHVGKQS